MEVSQQVLEWQAAALERGLVQGKAEGKAEAVLNALQLRFGKKLPRKLQQTVARTTALDQLNRWFEAAVTAPSLDDFRAQAGL